MDLNIKYTVYIKYSYEMIDYEGEGWHKHTCSVPVLIEDFEVFLREGVPGLKRLAQCQIRTLFDPVEGTFRNIQVVSCYVAADSDVVHFDPAIMIREKEIRK